MRFCAAFVTQGKSLGAGQKGGLWTGGVLLWRCHLSLLWRTLCDELISGNVLTVHEGITAVADQRHRPLERNTSTQLLCDEVEWDYRKHSHCLRGLWGCKRAPDCLQHSSRLFKSTATGNTASRPSFWGETQVYPKSLTGKAVMSKDAPGSTSALGHMLNGNVDYLLPVSLGAHLASTHLCLGMLLSSALRNLL